MSEFIKNLDLDSFISFLPDSFQEVSILSYGKRGIVLKAKQNNLDVAIKMARFDSNAKNSILMEAKYLFEVNKLGIGPQLIDSSEHFVAMEFIEGERIDSWILNSSYEETIAMLSVLFDQLFSLDAANINKSEMTNPYKHVLVKKDLIPVLIDFERARFNIKSQNITQFSQYLTSKIILPILQEKGILLDVDSFKSAIKIYAKERVKFPVVDCLSSVHSCGF